MKPDERNIVIGIVIVLAIILAWLALGGSGAINNNQNGTCAWNGQCTANITSRCCPTCANVRMCNNQEVTNPLDCFTNYCWQSGQLCYPNPVEPAPLFGEQKFRCGCKNAAEAPN